MACRPQSTTGDPGNVALWIVAVAWLPVVAKYIPWTYEIVRMALRGAHFTVGVWTLGDPFVTVTLVPASLMLLWRHRAGLAALLLVVTASGWVLWEVVVQRLQVLREPLPQIVAIQVLSVATLAVVGGLAGWRTIQR